MLAQHITKENKMTSEEKLTAYAEELGLSRAFCSGSDNVTDLFIESHKSMRERCREKNALDLEVYAAERAEAEKKALAQAIENNWISLSDLKKMTMADISALLYEGE